MRHKLLILTTFICFKTYCFGQTYDKIATRLFGEKDSVLNYSDVNGQKQGLWLHYRMFFNSRCSGLSRTESDTCYRQISKGFYKNDLKVGKWEYYKDEGCSFAVERTENYELDGSVNEVKYCNTTVTTFNKDSSFVVSTVIVADKDTIHIKCFNKNQCVATFKEKTVFTFPYDDLDLKQFKFAYNAYEREIRLMKK